MPINIERWIKEVGMTPNALFENSFMTSIDNVILARSRFRKHTILIVDDELNNIQLLNRTLRSEFKVLTASNGAEAFEVLKNNLDEISMIISDHKMPIMSGTEFLEKANEIAPSVIKILLTGFSDIDILTDAVNKCNLFQYIMKPFDPEDLMNTVHNGIHKFDLMSSKSAILKDLRELFYKTIKSISSALDAKDPYTHGHSLRVTLYSLILGKELNLDDEMLEEIETAGLLHDIGKIGIPQNILCKPGRLTDDEFQVMRSHPKRSEDMVSNIKKLKSISNWLKCHHERWDGFGYPNGLKGEEIPLSARIIALADTYDAMTSTRSYRLALSHEDAINEIQKCAGSQFDPELAALFVKLGDKMNEAKENPEEIYEKYSFLQKEINSKIV